jgi:hypothetical protein
MVAVIAGIFIGLNWAVMSMVGEAFAKDVEHLVAKPPLIQPGERIITTQVFISLIGATVVQVGIAIATIVAYLFPKAPGQPDKQPS